MDNIDIHETIKDEVTLKFYEESSDYKNLEPTSLGIFDSMITLNEFTYANLLVEFYQNLYDNEKDKFLRLAQNNFKLPRAKKTYISMDKSMIKSKMKNIEETVFYETNFSSEQIIKIIFILKDEMNLQNIEIILRDK